MYPIKYPLEAFVWRLHDGHGNAEIAIRDADRRTIFFMRINGRAMDESTRLINEIVPLVVKLLNSQSMTKEELSWDNALPGAILQKVPFLEAVSVADDIGKPAHEWLPEPTPEVIEETKPKPKKGRGRPKKK
jgi:hypothetical protein